MALWCHQKRIRRDGPICLCPDQMFVLLLQVSPQYVPMVLVQNMRVSVVCASWVVWRVCCVVVGIVFMDSSNPIVVERALVATMVVIPVSFFRSSVVSAV